MTKYARLINSVAIDVVTEDPATLFHADVAAEFVTVPDDTQNGDRKDGSVWTKYVAPAAPVLAVKPPTVSPPHFKLLIFAELPRILEKAATDHTIAAFVSIIDDPRLTEIDLSLTSVTSGLTYCFTQLDMDAPTIEARLDQVKTGVWS